MMERLVDGLPNFGGPRARTRCFAHVINLVAKSLIRLFNQPTKKGKDKDGEGDDDEEAAAAAAVGKDDLIDVEDLLAQLKELEAGVSDQDDPDDTYDAFANMTDEDRAQFAEDTKVVASGLRKVHQYQYHISSILILV